MEARWISALVGGRAPFFWFSVQICWGDVLLVTAALLAIRSPQLQPHLGGDVEKLVGVVCFSRTSSGGGGLRIVMELHRRFILLLRLWDRCGLFDPFDDFPSITNNVKPALGGAAAAARRRHGLEVKDEGHIKDLVLNSFFVEMFCTVLGVFLLMPGFFSQKKGPCMSCWARKGNIKGSMCARSYKLEIPLANTKFISKQS